MYFVSLYVSVSVCGHLRIPGYTCLCTKLVVCTSLGDGGHLTDPSITHFHLLRDGGWRGLKGGLVSWDGHFSEEVSFTVPGTPHH